MIGSVNTVLPTPEALSPPQESSHMRNTKPVSPMLRDGSLTSSLLALNPGDTHVEAKLLDPTIDNMTPAGISKAKQKLSSLVAKSARRLIDRTGGSMEFEIETAVLVTTRNRVYVQTLISRSA